MATQGGTSTQSRGGISTSWIVSLAIGAIVAAVMSLTKAHHHSAGAALFVALLFMFVIALIVRGVIWLIQKTA